MPSKLIVTSGPGQPSIHPIEDLVIRIGSGPQCEILLDDPSLPVHMATLEYLDGGYVLHNRGDDPLEVAGRSLSRRDSTEWQPGEQAEFGDLVSIILDVEGDPAPAKASGPAVQIEVDPEDADEEGLRAPGAGKASNALLYAVILASVPLCGWMLMMDSSAPSGDPARGALSFPLLLERLQKSEADRARGPHSFRATLQRARSAQDRGDLEEAREIYGSLRDRLLLRPTGPENTFPNEDDQAVWNYLAARLQALSEPEKP